MTTNQNPYETPDFFYMGQLRKYLIQVMAIFSEFRVEVGSSAGADKRLIAVPVYGASKDRVVASIIADNTQIKPVRIPCFSVYMSSITQAPELRKGVGFERKQTYLKQGGLYPDDIRTVFQVTPVPYRATFDVTLFVSNTDQHYQVLEQILTLFDPSIQIQTADDYFDTTRLTTVELTDIGFQEQVPAGTERRAISTTLSFSVPVYLTVPAKVKKQFVEKLVMRLGYANYREDPNIILDDIDLSAPEVLRNVNDFIRDSND